MNLKLLLCIGMGVFMVHLAVFMISFTYRTRQLPPPPPVPKPTLRIAEQIVIDPTTKEKIVNREITVTTKLRPELYRGPEEATPAPSSVSAQP